MKPLGTAVVQARRIFHNNKPGLALLDQVRNRETCLDVRPVFRLVRPSVGWGVWLAWRRQMKDVNFDVARRTEERRDIAAVDLAVREVR